MTPVIEHNFDLDGMVRPTHRRRLARASAGWKGDTAAASLSAVRPLQDKQGKSAAMVESGLQQDNRIDLTPLLAKARQGDRGAFDRLMRHLRPPVLNTLRKQGATLDDAEDAANKAMMIVYRLLRENRFDAMQTGGFIAYFRKVAVHEWMHRPEIRRAGPITHIDPTTGEMVDLDVPDTSQPLAERIANLSLYDFLMRQLDEVFVAGRSGANRDRGEMEKLAFIYFYQDGRTQNEIYDILAVLGCSFPQMTPVSRADLNNWLSMGRSLKALLKHLAEGHAEIIEMFVDLHLTSMNLTPNVAETLRRVYRDRQSLETIAEERCIDVAEVRRELISGKKDLIEALAHTIKAQLKASRCE